MRNFGQSQDLLWTSPLLLHHKMCPCFEWFSKSNRSSMHWRMRACWVSKVHLTNLVRPEFKHSSSPNSSSPSIPLGIHCDIEETGRSCRWQWWQIMRTAWERNWLVGSFFGSLLGSRAKRGSGCTLQEKLQFQNGSKTFSERRILKHHHL